MTTNRYYIFALITTILFGFTRKPGQVPISDVYFKHNSTELQTTKFLFGPDSITSMQAVDIMFNALYKNKDWIVEICGCAADNELNPADLSKKRALYVIALLKNKGISKDRLKLKVYGTKYPIISIDSIAKTHADTDKLKLRDQNRRATLRVIDFKGNAKDEDD